MASSRRSWSALSWRRCSRLASDWSVHFEARCKNLAPDLKCRVYENRPHICRSFDNTTCEVNSKEGNPITFTSAEQFLDWLEVKHPKVYKSISRKHLPEALLNRPRSRPAPAPRRPRKSGGEGRERLPQGDAA